MIPRLRQEQKSERNITQKSPQLSSLELIDYIKEFANENPFIKEINYDDYVS